MLTMFALLLQTASLDADPATAANQCAIALTIADTGTASSPLRMTSQFSYLTMQSVVSRAAEGEFFGQLEALSVALGTQAVPDAEEARQLAALCDRRFPIARSTAAARLPSDPFRRDVLCLGALSLLKGAAEEHGDSAGTAAIEAGIEPLMGRLTDDALTQRGLTEASFTAAMADELIASLPIGNPITVAAACGVKLD